MVATAAHLTDHVFPRLPVRQWVLAVPKRLRYFLHRDADLQGAVLRVFLRVVEQCLRTRSPGSSPAARLGAVAFIHRFGSTLNAHLHFHCVVIDGVFESALAGGVIFRAATGLRLFGALAVGPIAATLARIRQAHREAMLSTDRESATGGCACLSPQRSRCIVPAEQVVRLALRRHPAACRSRRVRCEHESRAVPRACG